MNQRKHFSFQKKKEESFIWLRIHKPFVVWFSQNKHLDQQDEASKRSATALGKSPVEFMRQKATQQKSCVLGQVFKLTEMNVLMLTQMVKRKK